MEGIKKNVEFSPEEDMDFNVNAAPKAPRGRVVDQEKKDEVRKVLNFGKFPLLCFFRERCFFVNAAFRKRCWYIRYT